MDKVGLCFACNDSGKRCFAASGRPPEDHGKDTVTLNGASNHTVLARNMGLPDKIFEGIRTHTIRKGAF